MAQVEFFFDCSSPWTYLAFHRVESVCKESRAELIWKPILVGGVFNEVNQSVYQQRANPPSPRKLRYYLKDLRDWSEFYGLRIGQPSVFPVNSVKAMRGVFVAEEAGVVSPYVRAVFESYWGDLQDISQDEVLAKILARVGLDEAAFFEKISQPSIKGRLRANTDELIQRGGFGSPTFFVNGDDMYFGNDRLVLVAAAARRVTS